METVFDPTTVMLLVIVVGTVAALLLGIVITKFLKFRHELMIINMEISRTTGEEREYWKKEKQKLWQIFFQK